MTSFVEPHASAYRPTEQQLREVIDGYQCCGYIAFLMLKSQGEPIPPEYDEDMYKLGRSIAEHDFYGKFSDEQIARWKASCPECTEDDVVPFIKTGLPVDDLKFIAHVCGNWKFLEPTEAEVERYKENVFNHDAFARRALSKFETPAVCMWDHIMEALEDIKGRISTLPDEADLRASVRQLVRHISEIQNVIDVEYDFIIECLRD